nr:1,4-alpha-glucan-branching enzyme [Leptinotarsa decemlineata]
MGGKYSKMDPMEVEVPHINNLLKRDGYLKPYEREIRRRYACFKDFLESIEENGGGLENFTKAYTYYGLNVQPDNSIICREWAPGAKQIFLTGEFNGWNRDSHPYKKLDYGKWELVLPPDQNGMPAIKHLSEIKVVVENHEGCKLDRLSPFAKYVVEPPKSEGTIYKQKFWNPPQSERYIFKNNKVPRPKSLRIYECHVGIATSELKVGTYDNFTDNVLPRIVKQGYNCIQLMAVMEHAYYASFGYQVTSFYAVSSRYGTPDQLKRLVDRAHELGLVVLLDLVHSHASKNVMDGLNQFDGTDADFINKGVPQGSHSLWDSRLFNYSEFEVLRFLLSNIRWYMEEYQFDGFRFDGVTSMLYHSRGIGQGFGGSYDDYFDMGVDTEGVVYLMLANYTAHTLNKDAITIAEDVSGMPGTCRPVTEGCLGFDYSRIVAVSLNCVILQISGAPRLLKTWRTSTFCIPLTFLPLLHFFRLMDKEMYTHMSTMSEPSTIIDRGIALHKLIRFVTHGLGGEAYLNFIGNEFGHPEWLDFPREGNNSSYHYARRQWNLVDDDSLKYKYLNEWDAAMNHTESKYGWLAADPAYVSTKHESDKIIAFERAGLLFVFNFHPTKSFADYRVGIEVPGEYQIVLSSDDKIFGGFDRINKSVTFFTHPEEFAGRRNYIQVYIPSRTAILLAKK